MTNFAENYKREKKFEELADKQGTDLFDSDKFYENMEDLRLATLADLKVFYPNSDIEVRIPHTGKHRDYTMQKHLHKKGASKSTISLHNFGAAADFAIFIDGKMYGSTKNDEKNSRDITPYKILGGNAVERGYFWGWKHDTAHVAETRFVDEFLKQNPALVFKNPAVKDWYTQNYKKTKKGYSHTMEYLDEMFEDKNPAREYTGKPRTIDELEEPIYVNKDVKQVFQWLKPTK